MSIEYKKEMLQLLRYYNNVDITHTFSKNGQPVASVSCLKNTNTLQITFFNNHTVEKYETIEEAVTVIETLIK